jgi:hypothetical protein
MTKTCSKCKQLLPLTDFCLRARHSAGLKSACRECELTRQRLRRQKQPFRDWQKNYDASHRTEKADRSRKYYKEHLEVLKDKAKQRRKENPGLGRGWWEANPDKIKLYYTRQQDALPDSFIRKILCHKNSLTAADIPDGLVQAKREQLRIIREIKKGERL